MLLASASVVGWGGSVRADSPVVEVVSTPIPAERAGDDVELLAPTNSTLEIRIARRPWLFERLTKPSPAPSVKMDPPRPPREIARAPVDQPPSAEQLSPQSDSEPWVARGSGDVTYGETPYADVLSTPPQSSEAGFEGTADEQDATLPGRADMVPDANPVPLFDTAPQVDAAAQEDEAVQADPAPQLEPAPQVESEHPPDNEEPEMLPGQNQHSGSPIVDDQEPLPLRDPVDMVEPNGTEDPELGLHEHQTEVAEEYLDEDMVAETHDSDPEFDSTVANPDQGLSEDEVTVRKLRINRDGTPVGDVDEESFEPEMEEEVSRHNAGATVGDLPEEVHVEDERHAPERTEADRRQADYDYTGYPRTPIRLTSSVYRIQGVMRQCLRYYYARPENANERSNWGMLHAIMVYGADTKIIAGNKSYSAIAWIAGNNPCRGNRLIEERDGRIAATSGIGLQGHQAQMLAIFGLCDVPAGYPLYAGDRRFTVQDLVKEEMLACRSGEELTFTLIGLSHYLDTDAVWKNESGETWNFERLLREELAQPIVGAACGGTHRLMGYAHALRKRRAEGKPITGQWKRADVYCQDFVRYVYRLQNRDGSMSTDWFEGREDNGDLDRKIQTTGHMVEWLLTVTPDAQLQDPRLVNAVRFLLSSMYNERTQDWKVGPKGHALRSLAMYYERVYQQGPAWRANGVATGQSNQRR